MTPGSAVGLSSGCPAVAPGAFPAAPQAAQTNTIAAANANVVILFIILLFIFICFVSLCSKSI
jgi:hypothetical protein